MDDAVPRLIGLLLAGAVALLSLRAHWGDTPQDRLRFRVVLVIFIVVASLAVVALLRGGEGGPAPSPDGPTTVADLRRPAAPIAAGRAYVDNGIAESHKRGRASIGAAAAA